MENLNVLVEAKKEYTEQLNSIMCPLMIEVFQEIYNEASKPPRNKTLQKFQNLLREVKHWNNSMISEHNTRLLQKCPWFNDLLVAVFISHVKILSSVRIKTETKKISIKLPTTEEFLHACYIKAAHDLFKDPYIYHEESNEFERDRTLCTRFRTCIDETIKELVPIQEILKTYISQPDSTIDDIETLEPIDPEIIEPEPFKSEDEEEPQETVEEDQTKEIQVKAVELPKEQEDEGILFGAAPDEKKKSQL
jgi:hypothetical protein